MLLAILAPRTLAGPPALDRDTVGAVPGDVGLVVVVNNAARQLERPAGRAMRGLLRDANLLTDPIADAWADLARRLRWDRREAFDQLLGTRFAFFVRYDPPEPEQWVLLTLISERTRDRVEGTIDFVPRGAKGGRIVNRGEGGGFLLALGPKRAGWSRVLLARPESAGLFDAALPMLNGERAEIALADNPAFARTPFDTDADALVVVNGRTGPHVETPSLTALSLRAVDGSYMGRLGVGWPNPAAWSVPALNAAWSPEMLDRLDDDALAVFLGVAGRDAVRGLAIPIDELPFMELVDLFETGRVAIVAAAEDAVPSAGGPTLGITLALETNDLYRTSVRADSAMAGVVPNLERLAGGSPDRPTTDYEGELYETVRVEPIADPLRATLGAVIGPAPALAWVGRAWGPGWRAPEPPAHLRARTGWWGLCLAAGGVDERLTPWPAERVTGTLSAERLDERPSLMSAGLLRPRRLVEWMAAHRDVGDVAGQIGSLAWIDEIRWSLRPIPSTPGVLEGELSVTLNVDRLGAEKGGPAPELAPGR